MTDNDSKPVSRYTLRRNRADNPMSRPGCPFLVTIVISWLFSSARACVAAWMFTTHTAVSVRPWSGTSRTEFRPGPFQLKATAGRGSESATLPRPTTQSPRLVDGEASLIKLLKYSDDSWSCHDDVIQAIRQHIRHDRFMEEENLNVWLHELAAFGGDAKSDGLTDEPGTADERIEESAGDLALRVLRYIMYHPPSTPDVAESDTVKLPRLPNTVTLNVVLSILAREPSSPLHPAHELLLEWNYLYDQGRRRQNTAWIAFPPDVVSYNTVLAAYARTGQVEACRAVFEVLEQRRGTTAAVSPEKRKGFPVLQPDSITYSTITRAYGIRGDIRGAQEWWNRLRSDTLVSKVSVESYNEFLNVLAKSSRPEVAETFLQEWIREYGRPRGSSPMLLKKESRHSQRKAKVIPSFAATARRPPCPNTQSYNIVLYALSRIPKLPDVQRKSGASSRRDTRIIIRRNSGVDTSSKVRTVDPHENDVVYERILKVFREIEQRDAVTFTTMVSFLCRRQQCLQWTGRRVRDEVQGCLALAWQDPDVVIDSSFVANILYSLAQVRRDREIPIFAEEIVQEYSVRSGSPPDLQIYHALLKCWGQGGSDRRVIERVKGILAAIEDESSNLIPTIQTYTLALDALGNCRHPDGVRAAEDIVSTVESKGTVSPNAQLYTALIRVHAQSNSPRKALTAAAILENRMVPAVQPNNVSYNAVLNAAEHTDTTDVKAADDALKMACRIFDEVRTGRSRGSRTEAEIRPTHITYGTFLGVIANLMTPGTTVRDDLVTVVFRRCCKEGLVSRFVLRKARKAAGSQDVYYSRLLGEDVDENRLPSSWTCNVRESRARDEL
jgi:pentatricopeptide repeat protein